MQQVLLTLAQIVVYFAEIIAAMVIIIGSIQAAYIYLRWVFTSGHFIELNQSRLKLGYSLSLGLGFLIGADVIKSAIAPSWQEIGMLASIIVLRIVLNYFLNRDLSDWEHSCQEHNFSAKISS